jgi:alkanesulfonate monooxygenase SsuD/methylene tetrahydromethanopterin reductase-like flavin-dependent oxidoreductase (luciferase family)
MAITVGVGINDPVVFSDFGERRRLLDLVESSGVDFVSTGDHLGFHGGSGFDGLVSSAVLLGSHPSVRMQIGVYLLGLRHPMPTARALATLAELAPGRLTLGVGVAGEDRREVFNAGVDPRTRGRRLDEALDLVQRLLRGDVIDHTGEFFELDQAQILPSPDPRIPILIGGKGDAAVQRTVRFGDGWLGIFCSARRFGATVDVITAAAIEAGRPTPARMGFTSWVGLDPDRAAAREHIAARMYDLYRLPYEKFQWVTASGTPADVADFLAPYVEAGAREFTLIPASASPAAGIELVGETAALLRERFPEPA